MKSSCPIVVTLLAAFTLSGTVGCTTPWSPRASGGNSAADVNPLGKNSRGPLRPTNHGFAGPPKRTWADSIGDASSGLVDALTIKPKVIPVDDPVSLATEPGHLGPELHLRMARQFEQGGKHDAALRQYKRVLELQPEHPAALLGAARMLDRQGEWEASLAAYRQAIQVDPQSPAAYNDLGLAFARQGARREAIGLVQRAVDLAPDRKTYRQNLAALLVEADRPDVAMQHLLAADPPAIAHYNLGFLLDRQGRVAEARYQFVKAAELDRRLVQAHEMVRRIDANAGRLPAAGNSASPRMVRLPSASRALH